MKKNFCTALVIACMMVFTGFLAACGGQKVTIKTENDVTTLKPGESTQLIIDAKEKDGIVYAIKDGSDYATLTDDGVLTIKTTAKPGNEVVAVAKKDNKIVSNELKITVGSINLETLTASSTVTNGEVMKGQFYTLSYTASPANTTEAIEWKIVEGAEIATISGNNLMISSTATEGAPIKVKAQGETKSSNELTFTVVTVSTEGLYLVAEDSVENLDAAQANRIYSVNVMNASNQLVAGQQVRFYTDDTNLLSIDQDGYNCELQAVGHGTATLYVALGDQTPVEVEVECIKAPEQVMLPQALQTKTNINFQTAVNAAIPGFNFDLTGTNVCQDVTVSFEKWNGTNWEKGEYGTYNAGTLTLTTQGKVRLTATSNSGSVAEKSVQFVFNVNDGVNVSTFEAFRSTLVSASYNGKAVNIVNLVETTTDNYNLIPAAIVNGTQTINTHEEIKIGIYDKNVKIYGNGYCIDLSGMNYYENFTNDYGDLIDINTSVENSTKSTLTQANYVVEIRDLDLKGSVDVNGSIGTHTFNAATSLNNSQNALRSSFRRAIAVGGNENMTAYQITVDNLNISNFCVGLRLCHAVGNSKVSNVTVNQIFINGIESNANIITFENMFYGQCGAAGIEITPDNNTTAGLDFSQNQSVTFAGTVETTNVSKGDTVYLQLFAQANDIGIDQLIQASLAASPTYSAEKAANVLNAQGQLQLIALKFNGTEVNNSTLSYSNELQDGIVNFEDCVANDPHKYIVVTLAQNLGSIILYNWNAQ